MLCASVVFYCLLRSSQIYMNWSMVNRSCPESDFKHCNSWRLNMFKVCPLPHNLATTYTRLPHDWSNNYFRSGKWSQAWQIGVVRDPGTHAAWYDRQPSEMMIRSDICICTPGSARPAPGRKFGKLEWLEEINCLWSVEVVRCMNEWANGCWDANDMTWKNPCTTEWTNQWTDEPMNQWINESVSQWISESVKQRSNDSMNQATSEPMNRSISETTTQWINGSASQWINESMNHWISEPRNQWINEWRNLADVIFQRCSIPPQFFCDFMWNRAVATVWCTFCGPHLPKVSRSLQFILWFLCEIELLLQSRSHLSKVFCAPQSFSVLKCKASSRYSPLRFSSTAFAVRAPNLWKQRPSFGDHGSHFTRKNIGFRARECFHPWIRARLNCYTSQLDDGWFTWWCGWHMLTWWCKCRPWQSSVTRKFANETSFGYDMIIYYVFYEILCINVAKEC